MEQKLSRVPVMFLTVLLAVAAYILRLNQLKTAFDSIGVIAGAGKLFTWITLLVLVLFGVYAFFLRKRKKYVSISSREMPLMVVSCLAALLMLIGSVIILVNASQKMDYVLALGGAAVAVCWIGTAMVRQQAKPAPAVLFLVPAVFYVADLVCQFRLWTRDPVILDYFYELGALICTMCALFHLAGFCFDKGGRRVTVFFCLAGVFFNAAAMAGVPAGDAMRYLAAVLWLGVNLWLLLRPGNKRMAEADGE